MKKSLLFGMAAALIIAGTVSASAADFGKVNTYSDNQFSDVRTTEWFASEVKNTYELGLMNGVGDGLFSPKGDVTVAQAITMAARASAIYYGETIAQTEGEWYQMYVDYAKAKGFVTEGQFDIYTRPAKRYEVAVLFENALPADYFTQKNNVEAIPDVSKSLFYEQDVLNLYKAGVVMGSDSYGNFMPENNITRAEAAAIINRVAVPENRLTKTLDKISEDDAYLLAYNSSFFGSKEGISSGWRFDTRGEAPRHSLASSYEVLNDISLTSGTALIRDINKTTTGKINLKNTVTLYGTEDGVSLEFRNHADKAVYKVVTKDKKWQLLNADGSYTALCELGDENTFTFDITVDLDNGKSTTVINKTPCGTHNLAVAGNELNILNFRFATDEKNTPVSGFGAVLMTVNYAVYDDFSWYKDGTLPYSWQGTGAVNTNGTLDVTSGNAVNYFSPVSGTVVAQTEFNLTQGQAISFDVNSGAKKIVSFTSDGTSFYANGVKVYENYVHNLWYRVRVEAKTLENKAVIYINGIEQAEVDFLQKTTSIDNISIANASDVKVSFDGVRVFKKAQHSDYVPVPVKPQGEEKYTVGLNVCSLWRNGTHFGWATISPYDDAEPLLGYYDEGNPETADWEIKYMVEHGIDFQAFCWYPESANSPLKEPSYNYQLYDGYKYAEYSDMMKYCLLWEAKTSTCPKDITAFKNYFVPYIIEHFIKDERYMTIDNKPVLSVFGQDYLAKSLGGNDGLKEAFDYLEQEVKKLGFDGMIYLCCGTSTNDFAQMGFDGTHAYNWGKTGYLVETNTQSILKSAQVNSMYTVPTISVGFNSIPWHGERYPLMTVEDYRTAQTWVRDEYLPNYAQSGTWQENFVMLSTWNEYGEGTYIMPTMGNGGFGYLDVLREVFTDEKANNAVNTVPTAAQKARINRLYPQYSRLLRKQGYYDFTIDPENLKTEEILDFTSSSRFGVGNTSTYEFTSEGLKGTVEGDTLIRTNVSLDASKVMYLRVMIDVPTGTQCQIYFTTTTDKQWNSAKKLDFIADKEGMAEYILDMSNVAAWRGTIDQLRIDPGQTENGVKGNDFVIKSIELASSKVAKPSKIITINGISFDMKLPYEISEDGQLLVPFDPSVALDYKLNALHTWDAQNKKLTLELEGHTVVYTVGKDTYTLDGAEKKLGYTLYQTDALPMLPIKKLCTDVGYTFEANDANEAVITTNEADYITAINNYKQPIGVWEFTSPYEIASITPGDTTAVIKDGVLMGNATERDGTQKYDPKLTMSGLNINALAGNKVVVGMKYELASAKTSEAIMFFATNAEPSFSGTKNSIVKLGTPVSENVVEYVFDFSANANWKGAITAIRLDPISGAGSFEIDYIRFVFDGSVAPDAPVEEDTDTPDASLSFDTSLMNVLKSWEFNEDGNFEGFKGANAAATVENGFLIGSGYKLSGNVAYDPLFTVSKVDFDAADGDKVIVGMKHKLDTEKATNIIVFFTTDTDTKFDGNKNAIVRITKQENSDVYEYVFDFSKNSNWKGKITSLRVDPVACAGTFEIDYIRLASMDEKAQETSPTQQNKPTQPEESSPVTQPTYQGKVVKAWEFDEDGNLEGFKPANATVNVEGGFLTGSGYELNGNVAYDPILTASKLDISADKAKKVVVGMKHSLDTAYATSFIVFFATDTEAKFDGTKNCICKVTGAKSNGVTEYVFDFSSNAKWDGTITSLRIDPFTCAGTFEIDYIRVAE